MTPLKLIILDRDGTINEDREDYVKSPDEWVQIPGALEAIARYQGFSRKDLHPSKFSRRRLKQTLERAGFVDVDIRRIALGWVRAATAKKRG